MKSFLKEVTTPTLFFVDENNPVAIESNRDAFNELREIKQEKKLEIIPEGRDRFNRSEQRAKMGDYIVEWFKTYMLNGNHA